eukprot:scaffold189739_cov31-Tisochrysis_lutea.AAC.3
MTRTSAISTVNHVCSIVLLWRIRRKAATDAFDTRPLAQLANALHCAGHVVHASGNTQYNFELAFVYPLDLIKPVAPHPAHSFIWGSTSPSRYPPLRELALAHASDINYQ